MISAPVAILTNKSSCGDGFHACLEWKGQGVTISSLRVRVIFRHEAKLLLLRKARLEEVLQVNAISECVDDA